jgi:hypothetical protein
MNFVDIFLEVGASSYRLHRETRNTRTFLERQIECRDVELWYFARNTS